MFFPFFVALFWFNILTRGRPVEGVSERWVLKKKKNNGKSKLSTGQREREEAESETDPKH